MSEDNILLYVTSILCIILNLYLLKVNKKVALIVLIFFALYSLYFYYKMIYQGEHGSVLLWWFLLIALNAMNILFDVAYLIYKKYF